MNFSTELFTQFREVLIHYQVFGVGLLLLAGYLLGKLFEKIGLPTITGYILAGLLLSRSVTGIISVEITKNLHFLTNIALGIIALTIGGEFNREKIRRTGIKVITITLFESLFALIFVTIFLTITGFGFLYALLLGAIAAATDAATTVIIAREMRARGEFIDYLYGVVAFDDAVCVVLFSIIFALVVPFMIPIGYGGGLIAGVARAIAEIVLSALLGLVGGIILNFSTRKMYKVNEIMLISLSVLFLVIALALVFELSLLLANMVMGAVLINLSTQNRRIFLILEPLTPPLFAFFFILAGTELNIAVFIGGITLLYGFVYLTSRFIGKYAGVYCGAVVTKAPVKVRQYLGFSLFPQAGVAIGLALFLQTSSVLSQSTPTTQQMLSTIINIILLTVLINEFIGPIISKFGIAKGLEIDRR